MNLDGDEIAVIAGLAGTISAIAGVLYRDLLRQRDECQAEMQRLRADADALLESYRQRDAEEIAALRERQWQATTHEGDSESLGRREPRP